MDAERACFNKLQGLQVRGVVDDGTNGNQGDIWKMKIDEINFGILVRPPGVFNEKTPTGETQVTLMISEGLVAMALRKSFEHLWALPGSLGLMLLWAMASRILTRTLETRSVRFWILPRSLEPMVLWTVGVGERILGITRTWWPVRSTIASKAKRSQPGNHTQGSPNREDQRHAR